jgi:hypothetical protein
MDREGLGLLDKAVAYFLVLPANCDTPYYVSFAVCTFMFRSTLHTTGFFTSPNYGGPYPRNTMCQYIFTGRLKETVEIEFPEFYVDGIIPR